MSKTVVWRLSPMGIKNSADFKLLSKEDLQKEGLEYIKKLTDDGEIVEKVIDEGDKMIIKLKD